MRATSNSHDTSLNCDVGTQLAQGDFGVVPSSDVLANNSFAVCMKPRKQNTALHLGARDGQLVIDRMESPTVDGQRRVLRLRGFDSGAHLGKRRDDAAHWPLPHRVITAD